MLIKINGVRVVSPDRMKIEDFETLEHEKTGETYRTKRINYCTDFATFDIETSRIPDIEQSFMYIAMLYIQNQVVIMRTWDDIKEVFNYISKRVGSNKKLIIFVHNLSYEAQFLFGVMKFDSIFMLDKRKIAKLIYKSLEFRCSYIQTNKSLKSFTKGMKHEKQDGDDFNYNEIRFPWDEIPADKMGYCVNDVVGLYEAMKQRIKSFDDTLYTLPTTSTGYVRRLAKRALQPLAKSIKEAQPDEDCYIVLREAFRGGDCHANRYYANKIIENVISYDMSSAYPFVMIHEKFPMKFEKVDANAENIVKMMHTQRAVIARFALEKISLKNPYSPVPYIPLAKCRNLSCYEVDNGRILSAKYLEISLTEIDFRIIEKQYNFNIVDVKSVYSARKKKLPEPLINVICQLFKDKTELKGIEGQEENYMKSKNLLNSVYGLTITETVRDVFDYDYETGEYIKLKPETYENSVKHAFMLYQWGVYVTAYCRKNLRAGIDIAGENHVYNDTDSVKFVADKKIEKKFEEYNRKIKDSFTAIDKHGKPHTMGIYEFDGHYDRFKTMGAKKYAYEENGKLEITIAGVGKKTGAKELERHGGLSAMEEGFTFVDAGGLQAIYNDSKVYPSYFVGKKEIPITRNICLKPSMYTLGLSGEYQRLLQFIQIQSQNFVDNDDI